MTTNTVYDELVNRLIEYRKAVEEERDLSFKADQAHNDLVNARKRLNDVRRDLHGFVGEKQTPRVALIDGQVVMLEKTESDAPRITYFSKEDGCKL